MDIIPAEITTIILHLRYSKCVERGPRKDFLNGILVCRIWHDILCNDKTYIKMRDAICKLSDLGGYAIRHCALIAFERQLEKIRVITESMGYIVDAKPHYFEDEYSLSINSNNNTLLIKQKVAQGCFIANYEKHLESSSYRRWY